MFTISILLACNPDTPLKPFLNRPEHESIIGNDNQDVVFLNQGLPATNNQKTNDLPEKMLIPKYSDFINKTSSGENIKNNIKPQNNSNNMGIPKKKEEKEKGRKFILNFDGSGSMQRTDPTYIRKTASQEFIKNLPMKDQSAIYEFYEILDSPNYNNYSKYINPNNRKIIQHQSLTSVVKSSVNSLEKLGARGGNPFYSSLIRITELEKSLDKNTILINITDGDATDPEQRSEAASMLLKHKIITNIIGIKAPGTNYENFKNFAQEVNGKFFMADSTEQLKSILEEINNSN